jgi:hypothetical protein
MAGFEGIRPRIVGTLRSHTAQRGDAGEKWLLEEMGFDATRLEPFRERGKRAVEAQG